MRNLNVRMSCLNKTANKGLALCLALCLSIASAMPKEKSSAIPPGNWGLVGSLPEAASISVRMTSGDRVDGKFVALDPESIRMTADKQERIYPRNSIAEVWELGLADSKLNGTLIGMGIGIGAGAVAAGTAGQLMSNEGEDAWGAMMLAVGAGIGTLTGFAVDSSIKGERLIYRK
jgi:hypothetical protein